MGDHLGDANRTTLSSTPLTRALHRWVSEQVEQLAQQITKAQARETKPEDREKAKRALTGLRDLMRAYLEAEPFAGDDDDVATGGNGQGNRGRRRTKRTSFGERVDEIVLEPTMRHISLALGTRVPVLFRCYEVQQDGTKKPVRDASTHLCSSDEAIGRPSDDLTVTALTEGVCELWVESNATGKLSNRISLEVIRSSEVDVLVPEEALRQGQRLKIRTVFHTERGPRDDLLIQATIDEPNMAWIGRHGLLTTGLQEGVATLRVRFGPDGTHQRAAEITIGAERVPPKGVGGAGGNIPDILLCGEEAPGMDAYPIDQRTHHGGDHYPTIIEEPQFPSVVWINPNSKEASRVRRSRGGPSGMGGIGTKTFMHFVALKCFEILKRLRVRQEIKEQTVNETQFCQLIAQAEMDCATFIDAAYELSEQLLRGEGEAS